MGKVLDPIGAVAGGVGAVGAAGINAASQNETNKLNYQMFREGNEFNAAEAQKNRDFTSEQNDTAWERQKEMFEMETQYNSPVEVVKRLRAAGINPALAMQGGLGSAMSSPAQGGVPAPAAGAVASSVAPPQMTSPMSNFATGILDAFSKAISIKKEAADAKKAGVEAHVAEESADAAIQAAGEDLKNKRLQNSLLAFQDNMNRTYGSEKAKAELNETLEKVKNLIAQGDLTTAQKALADAQKDNQLLHNQLLRDEYDDLIEQIRLQNRKLDEEIKAIPLQVQAGLTAAAASMLSGKATYMSAETQDFLAHNPTDAIAFLIRGLQDNGITPKDAVGKVVNWIKGKLEGNSKGFTVTEETKKEVKRKLPKTQQKYWDYYWDKAD